MNKNLFFKICAILLLLWLFLFLYSNRYYFYESGGHQFRADKYSGSLYMYNPRSTTAYYGWQLIAE